MAQILRWIDKFNSRLGRWPKRDNGRIPGSLGGTWSASEQALRKGHRGTLLMGLIILPSYGARALSGILAA